MEKNAEIIKLKTISAAKITASVVAILFMLIFMEGASQGSTRHTVYANSSTKPRIAATLASAKPVDLDNLDKNFPVKVHMIANDKSTNAFLLESDGTVFRLTGHDLPLGDVSAQSRTRTPSVVVSRRMNSAKRASSSLRAKTVKQTAGRSFFIWMGVNHASSAPVSSARFSA